MALGLIAKTNPNKNWEKLCWALVSPKLGKKHDKCDPRILSRPKPHAITVDMLMLPHSLAVSTNAAPQRYTGALSDIKLQNLRTLEL